MPLVVTDEVSVRGVAHCVQGLNTPVDGTCETEQSFIVLVSVS